ncbi:hypothetical protein GTU79_16865 [Sodalis ligni]|uniref:hypothetical protein n=1 Tax=Sodalis ligni TaxID=2697027 RepID=UPI001BDF425D|nr:hypothetical protein GTU79_16865 [Sodalis ligni]
MSSPVRSDKDGRKFLYSLDYIDKEGIYSFNVNQEEERSFLRFLHELEPNNPNVYLDSRYSYDIMRVEQHYATQTTGLDISFDVETAIFFATYKLKFNSSGLAYHTRIKRVIIRV